MLTNPALIAPANILVGIGSFCVAIVYSWFLSRNFFATKLEKYMAIGICGVAYSFGFHRFYWALQRGFENYEATQWLAVILNNDIAAFTAIPLLTATFFYGFHLTVILKKLLGSYWKIKWGVGVILAYAFLVAVML